MTHITNVLPQGETERVEFKTSFGKAVIETLVAFVNTTGGSVYVGVKDNGDVVGVTLEKESLQKWTNEIKQKTEPSIIPDIKSTLVDGKTIVAIQVQEYPVKPIAVQSKYYQRTKGANHLMNATDIADAYLASMQYSWDSYPYPKAIYADLNEEKIANFINRVNTSGRFKLPNQPKEALKKIRLLKENLLYNVHIGRFKTPSKIIADNMVNENLYEVVEKSMEYIISHINLLLKLQVKPHNEQKYPNIRLMRLENCC